ncbi:tissue factor pathway inhibitor a isoform X1, partial [Tachysurus ichikawai]
MLRNKFTVKKSFNSIQITIPYQFTTIYLSSVASKSPCHLGDEPGPCRALVPRYFFDSKVNECRRFFYGGCFGNANNFKTLKECKDRCQPGNDTEEPQNSLKAEEKIESYGQPIVISDVDTEIASHTQPLKLPMPEFNTEP